MIRQQAALTFADGTKRFARIVPAMAKEGFLLSPFVGFSKPRRPQSYFAQRKLTL